jgi:hypothetical protein
MSITAKMTAFAYKKIHFRSNLNHPNGTARNNARSRTVKISYYRTIMQTVGAFTHTAGKVLKAVVTIGKEKRTY